MTIVEALACMYVSPPCLGHVTDIVIDAQRTGQNPDDLLRSFDWDSPDFHGALAAYHAVHALRDPAYAGFVTAKLRAHRRPAAQEVVGTDAASAARGMLRLTVEQLGIIGI